MESIRNKRTLVLAGLFVFGASILIGFAMRNRTAEVDVIPEGTDTDFSTHASIVDGEELLQNIGSLDGFEALSRDLFVFGRAAYEAYKADTSGVIGFRVTSDVNKDGNALEFEGRYGSSGNKIAVRVKVLRNNRLTVSITDTKTSLNIDGSLPSNGKRNQFIGTMPLFTDNYSIEYIELSDSFLLALYEGTSRQAAEKALADGLGVPDLSGVEYNTLTPDSAGESGGVRSD